MKSHPIASLPRSIAVLACIAALLLAVTASSSHAQQVTERDDGLSGVPQVVDPPSDRISSASAATQSGTTSSNDGDSNAPLIVGIAVLTVALLGSGTYVVRRHRRLAPGH